MAHLHLGILAYWLVNTLRHQLKLRGINGEWKEIVRIGNTQKIITTSGQNTLDAHIVIKKCSEPRGTCKLCMTPWKLNINHLQKEDL